MAKAVPRSAPTGPTTERASRARSGETIEQCVLRSLEQYFADLDGARPHALHEMVIAAVERPLLQFAIARTEGNQSAAAELLGINRNTLRKKLQQYRIG
jgi:Fis family transcriptional regulator